MTTRYRRPDVRQEEDHLSWKRVLLVALAITLAMAAVGVWSWLLLREKEAELRPSGQYPELDIGPRSEVVGIQQRIFPERGRGEPGPGQAINQRKREELARFGWTDKEKGLVDVPIDDAMQLVVEENQR
jgi:hypothetical protein